jgi:uncharacterized protein DUF4242
MKSALVTLLIAVLSGMSMHLFAQTSHQNASMQAGTKHLFIDVHQMEPGKVKYEEVAAAHIKDLAVEKKYGVQFIKYWVDESKGVVYCLSSANDTESIVKTHAEAHGLLPVKIYPVTEGTAAPMGKGDLFLDVHYLGGGNVSATGVAEAHRKDLAVEQKHEVNFINYWVDEKDGVVLCLAQAKDSTSIIETHREAHGLLPSAVMKVRQGE